MVEKPQDRVPHTATSLLLFEYCSFYYYYYTRNVYYVNIAYHTLHQWHASSIKNVFFWYLFFFSALVYYLFLFR